MKALNQRISYSPNPEKSSAKKRELSVPALKIFEASFRNIYYPVKIIAHTPADGFACLLVIEIVQLRTHPHVVIPPHAPPLRKLVEENADNVTEVSAFPKK